jgi:hypothetical protein
VHQAFGIAPNKTLTVDVFAASHQQARDNQFRDLRALIETAPCFAPYLVDVGAKRVRLCAHRQLIDGQQPPAHQALFEIHARDTSLSSARGQASIIQLYDEMAFIDPSLGAHASAELMYDSATPATKTFGAYSFSFQASSPWQMTGRFYANWQRCLQADPRTHEAVWPEMFTLQAPSWELYQGHEATQDGNFAMSPSGPTFVPLARPLISYDDLIGERAVNPETFDVEYCAVWATVRDAYLPPEAVEAIFDAALTVPIRGIIGCHYEAHADPARTNARFGFAIAHAVFDDTPYPDIVFDLFDYWDPRHSPGGIVNYEHVEADLRDYIDRFYPHNLTFDQFNSAALVDRLTAHVRRGARPVQTNVYTVHATRDHNQETYELLKKFILMGKIHAPPHDIVRAELLFLREVNGRIEPPSTGDVRTKDLVDCMAEVTWRLNLQHSATHQALATQTLRASNPTGLGMNEYAEQLSGQICLTLRPRSHNPARGRDIPSAVRRQLGL